MLLYVDWNSENIIAIIIRVLRLYIIWKIFFTRYHFKKTKLNLQNLNAFFNFFKYNFTILQIKKNFKNKFYKYI